MGLTKDLGSIPRAITVSGSNNNVGISKETPNAKLDVNGNVIVTGSLNVTQGITGSLFGTTSNAVSASYAAFATTASFATTATSASFATTASFVNVSGLGGFVQGGNSFGTQALIGTNDNQSLALETNGTVRMFVSSSGNVGIGTNSPAVRLDVSDDAPSGVTRIRATNISSAIFSSTALELFSFNGSSVSAGTSLFSTNNNFTYGTISSNQTNLYGVRNGGIRIATEIAPIIFSNGNSDIDFAIERMRITSGGNVGIGTNVVNYILTIGTPATYGNAEDGNINIIANPIGGTSSSPTTVGGIVFGDQNVTNAYAGRIAVISNNPSATTASQMRFYTNSGGGNNSTAERMRITSDGNVGIGTGANDITSSRLRVEGATGENNSIADFISNDTSASATYHRGIRVLAPSLPTGDKILMSVGVADNTRNMGQLYFNYQGNSSTSNFLSLGLFAVDEVLNIMGTGNVCIGTTTDNGNKLQVNGTTSSSQFNSMSGTVNVAPSTNTTFFTPSSTGLYLARIYLGGSPSQTWNAVIIFDFDATNILVVNQTNSTNVSTVVSGTNIQIRQVGGTTYTFSYQVLKIA